MVTVVEGIQGNTVLEIDIGGCLQSTDYFDYIQYKIRCIQYVESKTIINAYVVKALEADRFWVPLKRISSLTVPLAYIKATGIQKFQYYH